MLYVNYILGSTPTSQLSRVRVQVVNSTYALWTWHRNQDAYGEDSVGDQIYIVRQPDKCLLQTTSASSENNWWFSFDDEINNHEFCYNFLLKFMPLINVHVKYSQSLCFFFYVLLNSPSEGCPSLVSNSGYGAQKDIIRSGHLIWNAFLVIWMILISTVFMKGNLCSRF